MASIRKRSPWRVVTENDTAKAVVYNTLKRAVMTAHALVAQGTVAGFVQEPKKGQAVDPGRPWSSGCPGAAGRSASATGPRDRRLAEVHVAVKRNSPPALDTVDGCAPPTKAGPASRRIRPDEADQDDPEITVLLEMPQSEQQVCRMVAYCFPGNAT